MDALRTCRHCGLDAHTEEDLELFRVQTKAPYGRGTECKECSRREAREYRRNRCPQAKKNTTLMYQYGITIDDYNRMYTDQHGKCWICSINKDVLDVDHNHSTGDVRALLCRECNTSLGKVREDTDILMNMIKYIIKFNKEI